MTAHVTTADEHAHRIVVVEALDAVIPNLPQKLQKKCQRYLERRRVEFRLATPGVYYYWASSSARTLGSTQP